jgi:hypothetical protein
MQLSLANIMNNLRFFVQCSPLCIILDGLSLWNVICDFFTFMSVLFCCCNKLHPTGSYLCRYEDVTGWFLVDE